MRNSIFFPEHLHIIVISALSPAEFALCVGVVVHLPAVFADLQGGLFLSHQHGIGQPKHLIHAVGLPDQLGDQPTSQPIVQGAFQIQHHSWRLWWRNIRPCVEEMVV